MRASASSSRTCRGLPRAARSSSSRIGCPPCGEATASSPSTAVVCPRTAPMMTWSGLAAAMRRCTVCRQASMKSASAFPEGAQLSGSRGRPHRPLIAHLRKMRPTRAMAGLIVKRSKAAVSRLYKPSTRREELAFLPAALEIVETPPPPLAGATGGTIIALFCLALGWASFGKVDIVTTATGRIVPSGRTKVIQPFEVGVVRAIHVRDGQTVTTGEVLIELDPTMNDAERKHFES